MYIGVHYPPGPRSPKRCQTISAPCPDLSDEHVWRKIQNSPGSKPRASRRPIQREDQTRHSSTRRNTGSAVTITARAGARGTRATGSAATGPSTLRRRTARQHPERKSRTRVMREKTAGAIAVHRSTATTGAAGPRKRSSKSGNTISTANSVSFLPLFNPLFRQAQPHRPGMSAARMIRTPIVSMSRTLARCTSSDAAPTASSTRTTG